MCEEAQLGYAITYELIRELDARAVSSLANDQVMHLGYRTVDGGGVEVLRKVLRERELLAREHARLIEEGE
jgi:hypothetical protein